MASSSSDPPPPVPVPVPVPVHSHPPRHLMYKNRLQEFTTRSSMALPVYKTVSEGQDHPPKFRSTVSVGGINYTSQSTFPQKKAAEQEAARLALESIIPRTRDEGPSLVNEISAFSKSIMHEYAAKLRVEKPTYNTDQQLLGGVLPVFTTSLVFNGTRYTGDSARTKKEAEKFAARTAILSIMEDSSSETTLIEIIKSKSIFYDAIGKGSSLLHAGVSTANAGHISVTQDHKDTGVAASVTDNNNEAKVEFPESSRMLSTCQELQMQKQESSLEVNNVSLQPGSAYSFNNGSSSKKRRKNKNKANKKSRLESSLPIIAVPMNQVPPHTAVPMNQVPPHTAVPMNQILPCTAVLMNQVPPRTAVPMNQVYTCTSVPMNQVPHYTAVPMIQAPRTAVPLNQVPPFTAVPLKQVPPYVADPLNQVPCTAVPLNQVPPGTAVPVKQVPSL